MRQPAWNKLILINIKPCQEYHNYNLKSSKAYKCLSSNDVWPFYQRATSQNNSRFLFMNNCKQNIQKYIMYV